MRVSSYAMKSFRGFKAKSVEKIFPEIILEAEELLKTNKEFYYVGTKSTNVISLKFIEELKKSNLLHHTIDRAAEAGRAIDHELINPITGRYMTGSSSGSAINVFRSINDIGIGTDGGGSVLAPALSLNLFAFISPKIDEDYVSNFSKISTDGIELSPSIGYIARELTALKYVICKGFSLDIYDDTFSSKCEFSNGLVQVDKAKHTGEGKFALNGKIEEAREIIGQKLEKAILLARPKVDEQKNFCEKVCNKLGKLKEIDLSYDGLDRKKMIGELRKVDFSKNILISFEGPIDLFGYGDSLMGHYCDYTRKIQSLGHKYYLKVVNMLNLTALAIPSNDLSIGCLLIGDNSLATVRDMLTIAEGIGFERSALENRYFNKEV